MTTRALVLGGGGSAGNAWVIGMVAGLSGAVEVTDADLVVGTSSGATAAVQLCLGSAEDLYRAIVGAPPLEARTPSRSNDDHLTRTNAIFAAAVDPADLRRRLGAAAVRLDAESDGTWSSRWRAICASRLPGLDWPERDLRITAVDAHTGEPVVFDRDSGVDLVDAVAASTSSGLPYRIGERLFLDGGFRRNENADLARGFDRVLVLSPLGGRSRMPVEWGQHLAAQVDELRTGGSLVETVLPDDESLVAFGDNLMDPSTRVPAARAGYRQGRSSATTLRAWWNHRSETTR